MQKPTVVAVKIYKKIRFKKNRVSRTVRQKLKLIA